MSSSIWAPAIEGLEVFKAQLADQVDLLLGSFLVGYRGRTQREHNEDWVSVKDFGAIGDRIVDDQDAFVEALAFSDSVYVPEGQYLIGTGNISIYQKRLWAKPGSSAGTWAARGTTGAVIITKQTLNSPFVGGNGTCMEGLQFEYPDQNGSTITDTSAYPVITGNPIVYPPTINLPLGGANWKLKDLIFLNSYICISAGDPAMVQGCGRGEIDGCSAFVIKHFVRGYNWLDQVLITNYTLSPGIIAGDDPAKQRLYSWALRNATAFWLNKTDGLQVGTGIIYGVDLAFALVGTLAHSLFKISGLTLDGSRRFIDSSVTMSGASISDTQILCNTKHASVETYAPAIFLRGPNAPLFGDLQFSNFQCYQCLGEVIKVQGAGAVVPNLLMSNFALLGWGKGTNTQLDCPAILIDSSGTNANISDGFMRPGSQLLSGVQTAQANRFTVQNVEMEGGRRFASHANTAYLNLNNNRTFNTDAAFPDIDIAGTVVEVNEAKNRWAVNPGIKVSTLPWFIATQAASQTFTGALTTSIFGTQRKDGDNSYAPSTGIFTCKKPGSYNFKAQHTTNGGTAGEVWVIQIATTQNIYQARYTTRSTGETFAIEAIGAEMHLGDTAEVKLQRISGSNNFVTVNSGNENFFSGQLID